MNEASKMHFDAYLDVLMTRLLCYLKLDTAEWKTANCNKIHVYIKSES